MTPPAIVTLALLVPLLFFAWLVVASIRSFCDACADGDEYNGGFERFMNLVINAMLAVSSAAVIALILRVVLPW